MYEGGDFQPSLFGYIYIGEQENDGDTPGSLVYAYLATAALNIGDVVSISAAFSVNKVITAISAQKFAGVVVGGARTDFRVLQEDSHVGIAAAAVGEVVLVAYHGKVKVIADAAVAFGVNITSSAIVSGRVSITGATQGQIIGQTLEAAASAGDKILALISHR